ncbi:MAG: RNA methyltransferase [Crocinitomicaceae bacterium]|nr:RNA methyltransferase [Crocinitomicaceae bacterium]
MESLSKNKIKWIRSLQKKKNRDAEGLFIIEGEKMVLELIDLWPEYIELLCTSDANFKCSLDCHITDERTLKELSLLQNTNRLLAIARKPKLSSKTNAEFIVALDNIQDPGNMGTILRTCDWYNVDKIICSKNTVDIFNAKVIQSSMGSIYRIPVEYRDLGTFLQTSDLPIFGAFLEGENIYKEDLIRKGIIVMGNEGKGISSEIEKLITKAIHIPRFGGAESLNVSIATGIILSEFCRNN